MGSPNRWDRADVTSLHALTQHRMLVTRDCAFSAIALVPGEPVIQYGKLRIDRPNRRGQTLIDRIPVPEQHRLCSALKEARAIREGRNAGDMAPRRPHQTEVMP